MKWLWLAALPYVVVWSDVNIDYKNVPEQYQVRDGTVTLHDQIVESYDSLQVASDMAEALNQAHKQRTEMHYEVGLSSVSCGMGSKVTDCIAW